MRKRKQQVRRAVKQRGSQTSEPIELTDYVIVSRNPIGSAILRDSKTGKRELWYHNQDFAGYCVRIGEKNYEFIREVA